MSFFYNESTFCPATFALKHEIMKNIISWVEIPAADFERAAIFYGSLLDATIEPVEMGDTLMGFFPMDEQNVSGAIVKGEDYEPSTKGSTVYLNGNPDLSEMLAKVDQAGGNILVPKTEIGPEFGFFALFLDTEGNKVALHSDH